MATYFKKVEIDSELKTLRDAEIIRKLKEEKSKEESLFRIGSVSLQNEEDEELVKEIPYEQIILSRPFNYFSFNISLQNENVKDICQNYVTETLMQRIKEYKQENMIRKNSNIRVNLTL